MEYDLLERGGRFDQAAGSSPRHVGFKFPTSTTNNLSSGDLASSSTSSAVHSLTSASTMDSKLDISPIESPGRKGLLRDSVFALDDAESPE